MMTTSNEHNNAPAVPQGWTDADSDAARLALELECLLMDTKDLSVVSKWWGSANDALELHRQRLAATPAPAPAVPQGWPFGELSDGQIMATVGRMGELVNYLKLGQQWDGICNLVRQIIRERYTLAATPAPAPAQEVATLSLSAEDVHAAFTKNFPKSRISQAWINFAVDIAQAIAARAAKPAQEVGLTDEEIDRVVLEAVGFEGYGCQAMNKADMRGVSRAIIAALRAKGGK